MLFEDKEGIKILSMEVKQEDTLENAPIKIQDGEKLYIKERGNDYAENQYFKAELPKTLEHANEQLASALKEEENFKNTAKNHHYINVGAIAEATASDKITTNIPTGQFNRKEKIALKQVNGNKKLGLLTKSRRGRKPKRVQESPIKSDESTIEDDEEESKEKGPKTTKEKKSSSLNLRKAKELDAFIAEWKPELICDLCGEITKNFDQLRTHFKETHKIKSYIKCCEKKFFRRYVFANHIQLHLNPDTHKCEICGKSSSSKKNLKLHKKLMHELTKQLKCDICDKLFKQKVTLARHLLTHSTDSKDFICSECGKGFVADQLLKLHIKHVHNADRVCDQCGKTIHGFQAYKKHLMEHAGIERVKFTCDVCGQKFTTSNGLKKHKAAYHSDGSTIYICGVCGKVAASENALMNHKRLVHVEERRHKCTYCEKAFKRPLALREHIATHTGQDLYQCPHCPQTFKVSSNMHHHRKKVHPVEWEEGRKNRLQHPKININQVKKQVVL